MAEYILTDPNSTMAVTSVSVTGGKISDENYKADRILFVGSSTNSSLVVNAGTGTFNVALDPGHTLGALSGINTTVTVIFDPGHEIGTIRGTNTSLAVFLDPGHLLGSVTANAGSGSLTVQFDPGHELGIIRGNTNTLTVSLDPGHTLGTVLVSPGTGTVQVQFDPGHTLGAITSLNSVTTTVNVQLDPGHTLGTVNPGNVANTTAWVMKDINATATIPNFIAGSTSGVSASGVQLIAPVAGEVRKVYAYNISTTAISSLTQKFTNGAGTGPIIYAQNAMSAALATTPVNRVIMAVEPPGYLFAVAASTTLCIVLDTSSLVHYSVYWFNESA